MCCILCLCLCRMCTMELLAQSMSPTHRASGNESNAACSEFKVLSCRMAEQYPKSFRLVMFLLLLFPIMYIRKTTFTREYRIQHRYMEEPTYLGIFALNSEQLESTGLILMAWKALRRQLLPLLAAFAHLCPPCEGRKAACIQYH